MFSTKRRRGAGKCAVVLTGSVCRCCDCCSSAGRGARNYDELTSTAPSRRLLAAWPQRQPWTTIITGARRRHAGRQRQRKRVRWVGLTRLPPQTLVYDFAVSATAGGRSCVAADKWPPVAVSLDCRAEFVFRSRLEHDEKKASAATRRPRAVYLFRNAVKRKTAVNDLRDVSPGKRDPGWNVS